LDEAKRREVEWREKEQAWASSPTNSISDGWGVAEGDDRWVGSNEQLFNTVYVMYRGTWPSVESGIEVTINIDMPQAPSPRVDRSRPKLSNTYWSSTQNANATTLCTLKADDILLSILTVATPGDSGLSYL
jgi:hypothetical protein